MDDKIFKAAAWLADQLENISYGSASITVRKHEGRITRIEKNVTKSELV